VGSQPPMPVRMPGRVAGAERGKVPRGERAWLSGCVLPSAGTYRSCTRVSPGRDSACLGGRSAGTVLHIALFPGRARCLVGGPAAVRLQPPPPPERISRVRPTVSEMSAVP